jgi:hypothetical protein
VTDRTSQPQIISKLGKPFALSDIRVIHLAQHKGSVIVAGDGETGMHPSRTSFGTNLSAIAAGAGTSPSYQLDSLDGYRNSYTRSSPARRPFSARSWQKPTRPGALPPRDGTYLRQRFRASPHPEPFLPNILKTAICRLNARKELTVRTASVIRVSCGCSTMRRERERAHQWHWSA